MTHLIEISTNQSRHSVTAALRLDLPQDVIDTFLAATEQPLRMAVDHTMSTGDYFLSRGRPPRHPVQAGSQATPFGGVPVLLSRLKAGDVLYSGGNDMSFAYGPHITEPLVARGPVLARVPVEQLDAFWTFGRDVWEASYRKHELSIITVVRKGA
ncbi:hypothetical protein [Chelatococcus asaccharovorans]|uniref:Cyclophilin-like domain-containing protein n=1 Tax=Chelatococcus asaccharovorans TaxID=28210 RepID=A0A2V3U2R7_9HYPH|nr:hypothetical protein [Chelatococcus asaccharovorans]MBS7702220.1 hypothetical protein [Chelatococcus asaccharovorans]PXW56581.1 hypothetical protein C7450_108333 [Chelatococcus asaccharovorans]CAH1668783.1 conserved hypothetical protein [Chelatococcus asaccharovorans]CAH1679766.1 conserved hypothetical protein [Chelatococcus asaccharovorans]